MPDLEADVLEEVRRVARELGAPVTPELHHRLVHDLRLDSVGALTLAVALEDRFQVLLSDQDAVRVGTVGDLVALVVNRRREGTP